MHSRLKFDIGWRPLLWAAIGGPSPTERLQRAQKDLESFWPDRNIAIGLSERTLFDALLAELGLPQGAKVLMSGINIKNMSDIVSAHGLEIVAVDVDPATLAPSPGALLDAHARSGARLCVVAQLYGSVNGIEDAPALRERGVMVVEDAAQGFTGPYHRGDANADVSLFSFGPIKRRTALGGGVGVFRDPALADQVRRRLEGYLARSEVWLRRRALKYIVLKALTAPFLYSAVIAIVRLAGQDPDKLIGEAARGFSGPSLLDAIRGRPPKRMIALMAQQVLSAEVPLERQAICEAFLRQLPEGLTRFGREAEHHAFWLVPLRCKDPDGAIRLLRANGFDATRGTTSLRAVSSGNTPQADLLMKEVVYIPHPAGLSPAERNRLAQALSRYVAGDA